MKRRSVRSQRKEVPALNRVHVRDGKGAFDLWLERGLHQIYDKVAEEPLPEALLRLIEEDRHK